MCSYCRSSAHFHIYGYQIEVKLFTGAASAALVFDTFGINDQA